MEMNDKLPALNELLTNRPDDISFTEEEILEIVRGENFRAHLEKVDKGDYLDNFLSSLGWWINVANILLSDSLSGDADEYRNIGEKISEIMLLYPVAFEARYLVGVLSSDPTGLELVKRYWELARYIGRLGQRHFPEAHWDETGTLAAYPESYWDNLRKSA